MFKKLAMLFAGSEKDRPTDRYTLDQILMGAVNLAQESDIFDNTDLYAAIDIAARQMARIPLEYVNKDTLEMVSPEGTVNAKLRDPNTYQTGYEFRYQIYSEYFKHGRYVVRNDVLSDMMYSILIAEPVWEGSRWRLTNKAVRDQYGWPESLPNEQVIQQKNHLFPFDYKPRGQGISESHGLVNISTRMLLDQSMTKLSRMMKKPTDIFQVETLLTEDSGNLNESSFRKLLREANSAALADSTLRAIHQTSSLDLGVLRVLQFLSRQAITAYTGVSPELIGSQGPDSKALPIPSSLNSLFLLRLDPLMDETEEVWTSKMISDSMMGIIKYRRQPRKDQIERVQMLTGIATQNEQRKMLGLPEMEDEAMNNVSMRPGTTGIEDAGGRQDGDEDDEEPQGTEEDSNE